MSTQGFAAATALTWPHAFLHIFTPSLAPSASHRPVCCLEPFLSQLTFVASVGTVSMFANIIDPVNHALELRLALSVICPLLR